jgi:hypothetical protein
MSEPFSTTRQAQPCVYCGSLPTLGTRNKGDSIRFELCCKCGANVYSRHELGSGMDAYDAVDLLTKDWNEQMGEPFSTPVE